jgi:hypothetical protein
VFLHLRDSMDLRAEYDKLISDEEGNRSGIRVSSLHRRIGLMVKRVLHAEVKGRSLPLDFREHLIISHALLTPERTKESG